MFCLRLADLSVRFAMLHATLATPLFRPFYFSANSINWSKDQDCFLDYSQNPLYCYDSWNNIPCNKI